MSPPLSAHIYHFALRDGGVAVSSSPTACDGGVAQRCLRLWLATAAPRCKERNRTTHRQLEEFKTAVQEWQETCRKAAEADGTSVVLMDIAFAGIWCAFIGLQTDLLLSNRLFGLPSI